MPSAARSIHLVVACLLVVGLAVQIFLAGRGVFRGPGEFDAHRDFGYLLEALPVILLVAGLVGRMGRRPALLAIGIFALFMLQSILVGLRATAPEVAALHPLNGFLITFLAIVLARDSWVIRRTTGAAQGAASPSQGQG